MIKAQGVGASGDIKGTVTDPAGAVVSGATVTATDTEKAMNHTAVTEDSGQFRVPNLAPAVYDVSVESKGFETIIRKAITVTVGQTVVVDFQLAVSQTRARVEVTTEPPIVETEKAHQANTITEKYIAELPINRRDYLSFTLLTPAVSDSTRLASDTEFRVKQTPQSGLSFYGNNGRGNNITVDGGEANDDAGGVRLTLSQEAVREFQINRSNYAADLGGASGASINIISKSGSNDKHGSAFALFRDDAFDARNPFAFSQALQPGQAFNPAAPDVSGAPVKDQLSRQQLGGSFGFPIKHDKTFGFFAVEMLRENRENAVPILTNTNIFRPSANPANNQQAIISALAAQGATPVPCLTGQPAIPSATCAALLTSALTLSSTTGLSAAQMARNSYIINQFETNGGLFPFQTREYFLSFRGDHQFSDRNQMYLRYNFAHDNEQNPDVQSLTGFSRGSSIHAYDSTIQGAWFHEFSTRTQNELRGQFSYSRFDVIPNVPAQPGLDMPGFGTFGTNIFLPSKTGNPRFEFADNVSMIRGKHSLKFGGGELLRGNHTESHTFFPGRFVFGSVPGGVLSPCLQVPAACGLTANFATINSIQAASLGAPQFYQQGFGSPLDSNTRPFTFLYGNDSWSIAPNLTLNLGLRYEVDSQYSNLRTDKNNFAPRVSFSWDPFKDHKTVIRAGYGIFYSQIYYQIPNVVKTLGVVNGFRQIAQQFVSLRGGIPGNPTLISATVFQTLFAQGKVQCTTPASGQDACITPADLTQFGLSVTHEGPIPPFTVVFSGQSDYQNPYSQQAEFGIERELGNGISLSGSYIYVHTLHLPVAIDMNLIPAPFTTVSGFSFRNWAAPQCASTPTSCFVNPLILQANQYSSAGSAVFHGGIFELNKRFSHHFSLIANYTWSKAIDTTTDFNSDFAPQDQTNLSAERALSSFDQRHKFVLAGLMDVYGFELSPIVRVNSGHPFNLLAGSDVNGDRHSTNDRPIGAARNTGHGPSYVSFDMRLSRTFRIGENVRLMAIAEGFNLFNRTNYASVNNVVGPNLAPPFNVEGNRSLLPTQPLGFTSAYPMRQFQLGARLIF